MPRIKRRQIGSAALLVRFRDGTCAFTCHRCRAYSEQRGWRRALRNAHAHTCTQPAPAPTVGYDLTAAGLDAIWTPTLEGGGR